MTYTLPVGTVVLPLMNPTYVTSNLSWLIHAVALKRSFAVSMRNVIRNGYDDEAQYMFPTPIRNYIGFVYRVSDIEYDGN